MTLTIRNDPSHLAGGYALLEGPSLSGVTAITIENGFSGQFLGEDGRWGRSPFAFPVEETPAGALSLGPQIVDHVPTELQVHLRSGEGRALGTVFWTDVIPRRNPGGARGTQAFDGRFLQVEQSGGVEQPEFDFTNVFGERDRGETPGPDRPERTAAPQPISTSLVPYVPLAASRDPVPPVRRRSRWPGFLVFFLLALSGGLGALVVLHHLATLQTFVAERKVDAAPPQPVVPPPVAESPRPQPAYAPVTKPTPVPANPSPQPSIDCSTFAQRVGDLQGQSDAEKIELGEAALKAGCGSEAFQAFDASDPQSSEAAAWNLARFYDPNETNPVYRRAASVHPDYAAAYYKVWRNRSSRQANALAKICQSEKDGSASLRQACGR